MPHDHNPAIPADTNALIDQIERARRELMLTIDADQRSVAVAIVARGIDQHIQSLMDVIIDQSTQHNRSAQC